MMLFHKCFNILYRRQMCVLSCAAAAEAEVMDRLELDIVRGTSTTHIPIIDIFTILAGALSSPNFCPEIERSPWNGVARRLSPRRT